MFLLIILVIALTVLIYKWGTKNNDFFLKKGVPYLKPLFLIGSSGRFSGKKSPQQSIIDHYNKFPESKLSGFFDFINPIYLIRDPELIKQMGVKDFEHFLNHISTLDSTQDKYFGNSLLFLQDQKWKDMRSTLSPAFTGSKMKQMFELVSECGDQLTKHFLKESKKERQILEMKDIFSRFTNDVIATSAFGIKVNSLKEKDNEFFLLGQELTNLTSPKNALKFIGFILIPRIMKILKIQLLSKKLTTFFTNIITQTMRLRAEKGIVRPDMIHLLIEARKGNLAFKEEKEKEGFATVIEHDIGKNTVKHDLTDDEMIAQCFIFFVAGFDTSSTLMTFLSYELALNKDIQDKLISEIDDTNMELDGKLITYDVLQKMKYMDMVVSETLRKWPPVPVLNRICTKDYVLKDGEGLNVTMKKGTYILFPTHAIHRDSEYYPDADKFDPERFNSENKGKINLSTYMPFGIGPRNCIGSRFALMETKAVLYYILLNFTLEVCEKTDTSITLEKQAFGLTAKNGVWLELTQRRK